MVCQTSLLDGAHVSVTRWAPDPSQPLADPAWSLISDGDPALGVRLTQDNGDECNFEGNLLPRMLTVNFYCDAANRGCDTTPYTAAFSSGVNLTNCWHYINFTTVVACPDFFSRCPAAYESGDEGGGRNLSGGWVFIILLLIISVLYFFFGSLYKYVKHGARGKEMCPHVEFWIGLPSLVSDGCIFVHRRVTSCCARQPAQYSDIH
jgi:hypothetical protein